LDLPFVLRTNGTRCRNVVSGTTICVSSLPLPPRAAITPDTVRLSENGPKLIRTSCPTAFCGESNSACATFAPSTTFEALRSRSSWVRN
jgi:hypothetical protein